MFLLFTTSLTGDIYIYLFIHDLFNIIYIFIYISNPQPCYSRFLLGTYTSIYSHGGSDLLPILSIYVQVLQFLTIKYGTNHSIMRH